MTWDVDTWTRDLIADMRAHGGRPSEASGWAAGKPFLILTSKGAKSGEDRTAITTYHKDGDRWAVAASSDVKLHGYYLAFPEHTIFLIVETDDVAKLQAFLAPGAKRATCEVTVVSDRPAP